MYLDKAEASSSRDHFTYTVSRDGYFGILVPANWQVCARRRAAAYHVHLSVQHWACTPNG